MAPSRDFKIELIQPFKQIFLVVPKTTRANDQSALLVWVILGQQQNYFIKL